MVSGVSVIVRGPERPWGVLGAHTARPRAFGPDDAHFMQSVSNVLAEAIVRAEAEAALRVSRDQISAILLGVAEGVTVQAPDGRLVYANDTAARIVGYPDAASLVAAPVADILSKFTVYDEAGQPLPMSRLPGRQALQGSRRRPCCASACSRRAKSAGPTYTPSRSSTSMARRNWR